MNILFFHPAADQDHLAAEAQNLAQDLAQAGHKVVSARFLLPGDNKPQTDTGRDVLAWNLGADSFQNILSRVKALDCDVLAVFSEPFNLPLICVLAEKADLSLVIYDRSVFKAEDAFEQAEASLMKSERTFDHELALSRAARILVGVEGAASLYPAHVRPQVRALPLAVRQERAVETDSSARPKTIINFDCLRYPEDTPRLLEAFNNLAPDFPDWSLRIVPDKSPYHALQVRPAKRFIAEHCLEQRVKILSPDTKPDSFEPVSIHALAVCDESLPRRLHRAKELGLPTACPGFDFLGSEPGVLVGGAAETGNGLEQALKELMTNQDLWHIKRSETLGAARDSGPEIVLKRFLDVLGQAREYTSDPNRLEQEQAKADAELAGLARRAARAFFSSLTPSAAISALTADITLLLQQGPLLPDRNKLDPEGLDLCLIQKMTQKHSASRVIRRLWHIVGDRFIYDFKR